MMYVLLANLYLSIFYGFYHVFLRRETFFQWNRLYLLVGLLLTFTLPLAEYPGWNAYTGSYQHYLPAIQVGEPVVVHRSAVEAEHPSPAVFQKILLTTYIGGCLVAFFLFMLSLIRTLRMLSSWSGGEAFSFFRAIRIDGALGSHERISRHEQVHAREWHSLDIMLIQLAKIFNWFNPVVYYYERALRLQHEYIADGKTAADDHMGYAELLVSRAMGVEDLVLANTFSSKRLLKHRISMLLRDKSPKRSLLRYVLLLPVVGAMVIFSIACNQEAGSQGNADSEAAATGEPEGRDFMQLLGKQIDYSGEALQNNIQGPLAVAYDKAGDRVKSISFLNKFGYGQEAEVLKAFQRKEVEELAPEGKHSFAINFRIAGIETAEMPPPPIPISQEYTQLGDLVIVGYKKESASRPKVETPKRREITSQPAIRGKEEQISLPTPKMEQHWTAEANQTLVLEEKQDLVFQSVETNPEPVGGMRAFMEYIGRNYDYPQAAIDAEVNGQVQVSFIIEKDGRLTDIKVVRDLGHGTGEAAIRVLQGSGRWAPGIQNGRPVRVAYTLPIRLNLKG